MTTQYLTTNQLITLAYIAINYVHKHPITHLAGASGIVNMCNINDMEFYTKDYEEKSNYINYLYTILYYYYYFILFFLLCILFTNFMGKNHYF